MSEREELKKRTEQKINFNEIIISDPPPPDFECSIYLLCNIQPGWRINVCIRLELKPSQHYHLNDVGMEVPKCIYAARQVCNNNYY